MRKLVLAVLAVLAFGQAAQAALVLNVDSATVSPGQSVTLNVYLQESLITDNFSVDAYSVGLKLTPTNGNVTVSSHQTSNSSIYVFTDNTTFTTPPTPPPGYNTSFDRFVTDDGASAAIDNVTKNRLFTITYQVSPSATAASYALAFDSDLTEIANAGSPISGLQLVGGTINVVVPEPATLGLAMLGLPLILRRRK